MKPLPITLLLVALAGGASWAIWRHSAEHNTITTVPPRAISVRRAYPSVIARSDRIDVTFADAPDLNIINKPVSPEGCVNLPLVGEVHIGGITASQAGSVVEKAYRDGRLLADRRITLSVRAYAPRTVVINGLVKQPGSYNLPVEAPLTLKDLVHQAGGITELADGSKVRIVRIAPDGTHKIFGVNIAAPAGGAMNDAFVLQRDDMVFVPEKIL